MNDRQMHARSVQPLLDEIDSMPAGSLKMLARAMVEKGLQLSVPSDPLKKSVPGAPGLTRSASAPPDYTHPSVLSAHWADAAATPLESHEQWNKDRRATRTGLDYHFNAAGLPINPYYETGLNGRGVLGRFGPNHAVDVGILELKDDQLALRGIRRKYDGDVPAIAGGFIDYSRNTTDRHYINGAALYDTKTKEIFEEMISGSVTLNPNDWMMEDLRYIEGHSPQLLTDKQLEQIRTNLKLMIVQRDDPGFLERLGHVIRSAKACYAGPVIHSNRNTNNAWIETHLSWFMLKPDLWSWVKGPSPAFDYDWMPGDDASAVESFVITPDFLDDIIQSHRPFLFFMLASYLVADYTIQGKISEIVQQQCLDLI